LKLPTQDVLKPVCGINVFNVDKGAIVTILVCEIAVVADHTYSTALENE